MNSPALKTIADKYLEKAAGDIIVDLEICPGVDSTFMGTLAGLARKVMANGGTLQVAAPTQRTRAAMESLGLDMIIDLDPADAPWQARIEEIRATVAQANEPGAEATASDLSELERTRHVLEAHNTLRAMNKKNDETFGYVCETLEEDLQRHEAEETNK